MSTHTPSSWAEVELDDVVEVRDFEREPINSTERAQRVTGKAQLELYPYFGATGQVGWIDTFRSDGEQVLLGEDGAPFLDANRDKAYIVRGRYWVNNHAHVIRGIDGLLDNRLLAHQLNTTDFQPHVSGSTRLKLTSAAMKRIPLLLPPLREQTRIVEKLEELLSDLDAGVAELKAAQRKLAQYRQSLLKAAVEGALTADWRATRDTTTAPQETGAELLQRILTERRASWEAEQLAKFAEQERTLPKGWRNKYKAPLAPPASAKLFIPSEWAWTGIEQLAGGARHALKAGPFGSALKKEFYTSTGYKIYGQEQVINGDAHFGNYFISSEKYAELISCAIKPGDLLISLVGTTGKILVLPPDAMPGIINPRLLKVSLSAGNIAPAYIQIVLESPYARHFFKLNAHGGTMDVLNLGILKELAIPIPSMAEQEEIVQCVHGEFENIARQSSAIEYTLKQSAAQRKNILKAAFAGQLVPQDPNDEPASALLERISAERAAHGSTGTKRGRTPRKTA